ncbi:MAG: TetR/AcrR family transcriptional regulator [Propionibacteriaceae bacterium]|nr:MAG: TetR/AcrR family transcriptional regulator [Propionibacteriaceae bacterium]
MTDHLRAKRADATLNRQRILDAARAAFAASGAETSMAEVVRRSGLGAATLYRNFPSRQALLEAVLFDEVDAMCATAATVEGDTPGDRFENWLRRFFVYVTTERPVVLDLLVAEETDTTELKVNTRERLMAAADPLLSAARDTHEVRPELDLEQILDLVMAVAKIAGTPPYKQPIFEAALAGLRASPSGPDPVA